MRILLLSLLMVLGGACHWVFSYPGGNPDQAAADDLTTEDLAYDVESSTQDASHVIDLTTEDLAYDVESSTQDASHVIDLTTEDLAYDVESSTQDASHIIDSGDKTCSDPDNWTCPSSTPYSCTLLCAVDPSLELQCDDQHCLCLVQGQQHECGPNFTGEFCVPCWTALDANCCKF